MIQTAIDKWSTLPTWAKWTIGISVVVLIDAVSVARHERDFFAGLAEHSVAIVLRYGTLAITIAAGVWVGMQVAKRSKAWLGWVAGIGAAVAVGLVTMSATAAIPGVGWRIEAMNNSDCYVDWDGRSNPTVCD